MSYKKYKKLEQAALKKTDRGRCVLCGQTVAKLTREHVPPKSTYAPVPKTELLTVPACQACNGGTSEADKAFGFALGLFCKEYAQTQTAGGAILFNKLHDAYRSQGDKNLSATLKPFYSPYFANGVVGDPWTTWWKRDLHDPVIQKIFTGLYWLNHEGTLLADGDYYVSFGRGINFSTNAAQQVASQSFPGINIEHGQFIARHQQAFDDDPRVKGAFSLTLHFQCGQSPNAGYHLLCFAIPKSVMDKQPAAQMIWNKLQNDNQIPGQRSMYRAQNGHWNIIAPRKQQAA